MGCRAILVVAGPVGIAHAGLGTVATDRLAAFLIPGAVLHAPKNHSTGFIILKPVVLIGALVMLFSLLTWSALFTVPIGLILASLSPGGRPANNRVNQAVAPPVTEGGGR